MNTQNDRGEDKVNNYPGRIFIVVVLVLICLISATTISFGRWAMLEGFKQLPQTGLTGLKFYFETGVTNSIPDDSKYNLAFVDIYGMYQNLQQKRTDDGLGFFKDQDGFLLPHWVVAGEHDDALNRLKEITQFVEDRGGQFRYIQIPANNIKSEYPATVFPNMPTNEMISAFVSDCKANGIPSLDGNEFLADQPHSVLFDRTDHHWTGDAVFLTYQNLIEDLSSGTDSIDVNLFERRVWSDSFLGGLAVGMGQYYAGKDDYILYEPNFETSFTMQFLQGNDVIYERNGDFLDVLYDEGRLDDPNYYNKYNAALAYSDMTWEKTGDFYIHIENHMSDNDRKVLLISDSYGQPFAPYLALSNKEVAYLSWDGYYMGNYKDFINKYDPDLVLILKWAQSTYITVPFE